jgi:hypothetical protein
MADDKQKKDPAAQSMAGKRWAKTTAKQRSEIATRLNEARWAGHVPAGKAGKKAKAPKRKKK